MNGSSVDDLEEEDAVGTAFNIMRSTRFISLQNVRNLDTSPKYAYSEALQGLIFINYRSEASQIVKGRAVDLQESHG
jgi:hypothetical protein